MGKTVLAYSGGLDTTTCIAWIKEKYGNEVITVTVDVGQQEDFKEIEERAYKAGAIKHYFVDAKDEFANEYISVAIKANAMYEKKYPLSTSLARPLIAKKAAEIAKMENADSVAHGSTGKGNDQVRFDVTLRALYPGVKIIAPVREWNMSRDEELKYLLSKGIPYKASRSEFSVDENLWGRSIESGRLEDPYFEPPEEAFAWTVSPEKAPDKPEYLEIGFKKGVPESLNGEKMKLSDMIKLLNKTAGRNGVGRIDHVEDRVVGIKSREVYETPAALVLIEAHQEIEKLTLPKTVLRFKPFIEEQWSYMIYDGLWADPLRNALEAFINETQKNVEGEIRLKLFKGGVSVVGRKSEKSLYKHELSTYSSTSTFDQKQALGFINLFALQTLVYREVNQDDRYT